jgi:lysophospholipid acyltransferase (LPLAT)-like uncharacterized protein
MVDETLGIRFFVKTHKNITMKNSIKFLLFTVLILVLLTSCIHVQSIHECVSGKVYGFWNGLWHGMIAIFSFIGSLFDHSIAVYAVNNNGAWYNFGFLMGIGATSGGGIKFVHRR